ncbi:unnamed protein product, partial [marine sediment metagenome]
GIEKCGAMEVTSAATCCYAIIALATFIVVFWIGFGQLRQMSKEAHKNTLVKMLENWDSQNMIDSRAIVSKITKLERYEQWNLPSEDQIRRKAELLKEELCRLDKEGSKEYLEIVRISDYMEGVGYMMTSKKDRKVVKDIFGDAVIHYYKLFLPWIKEARNKYPRIYEYFTEIYEFCK